MSGLGGSRWLNEYIGIPYKFGGRERAGLDCYGLIKLIYQDRYQITLPDWVVDDIDLGTTSGLRTIIETIEEKVTSGDFTLKDAPCDGDFVFCYRNHGAHHCGVYFAGGVIHCAEPMGVVYETLTRFQRNYTAVEFGAWTP